MLPKPDIFTSDEFWDPSRPFLDKCGLYGNVDIYLLDKYKAMEAVAECVASALLVDGTVTDERKKRVQTLFSVLSVRKKEHALLFWSAHFRYISLQITNFSCKDFALSIKKCNVDMLSSTGKSIVSQVRKIPEDMLTHYEIILSLLSSLFLPVRQHIGSCFSTAPSIFIQIYAPCSYIETLISLLTTGFCKRYYKEKEYTVPLQIHTSYIARVKKDAPLLHMAFEYTLASFSDTASDTLRYHLSHLLGIESDPLVGMSAYLVSLANEDHTLLEKELVGYSHEFDRAQGKMRYTTNRLSSVDSKEKERRLQRELDADSYHLRSVKDMYHEHAEALDIVAALPKKMIDGMFATVDTFFTELYDPDIVFSTIDEDAPAGFSLYYTGGHAITDHWKKVSSFDDFRTYFASFVERSVYDLVSEETSSTEKKYMEKYIRALHSFILHKNIHDVFSFEEKNAETYFQRKSGGNMESVIARYSLSKKISTVAISGETLIDRACILIDFVKDAPFRESNAWRLEEESRILMQTGKHGCLFMPGLPLFQQAVEEKGFTYSWFRDEFLAKRIAYWSHLKEKNPALFDSFTESEISLHHSIHKGLPPLFFADSNWSELYFAFDVHPITHECILVVANIDCSTWSRMASIENECGVNNWILYPFPHEYTPVGLLSSFNPLDRV